MQHVGKARFAPGHRQPAHPIAAGAMHLAQAPKGDAGMITGQHGKRLEAGIVKQDAVINFIGEQDQAMLPRQLVEDRLGLGAALRQRMAWKAPAPWR